MKGSAGRTVHTGQARTGLSFREEAGVLEDLQGVAGTYCVVCRDKQDLLKQKDQKEMNGSALDQVQKPPSGIGSGTSGLYVQFYMVNVCSNLV